ncbi:MAG: ABC transporter permease [Acidimicrobiales bacterium]
MKPAPFIIVAAGLVFLVLRLRARSRRSPARRSPARRRARWTASRTPLGDTGLVAAREIRERLRGRVFRVVTLILLLVVGAAIVLPTLHSGSSARSRVGVVGKLTTQLHSAAVQAARRAGAPVRLVAEPSLSRARKELRAGHVVAVIDDRERLLVKTPVTTSATTTTATAVRAVASAMGIDEALQAARLSPAQAATVSRAHPLPVASLTHRSGHGTAKTTSFIGVVLVFIMLTQYLTWTLMGVMEEKSSRVVEVLLAAVRPVQLLGGKVLGIGVVAMAQACLVVAFALVLAKAVGSSALHGTSPMVIAASLVWLVLGYAFYSWVYAAAGSMVERQDQVQSLALPLSVPLIFGYIVALISASASHASLFVEVLAFLPPTAPFEMPILVATGSAAWWWFALSAGVSVLCTFAVARLAAGIYRRAVLRTGRIIGIRELLAKAR